MLAKVGKHYSYDHLQNHDQSVWYLLLGLDYAILDACHPATRSREIWLQVMFRTRFVETDWLASGLGKRCWYISGSPPWQPTRSKTFEEDESLHV